MHLGISNLNLVYDFSRKFFGVLRTFFSKKVLSRRRPFSPLNPNFHIRKLTHQPSTGAMVTLATLSYFSSTVTTPFTGVTVEEVVVSSAAVTVTV